MCIKTQHSIDSSHQYYIQLNVINTNASKLVFTLETYLKPNSLKDNQNINIKSKKAAAADNKIMYENHFHIITINVIVVSE